MERWTKKLCATGMDRIEREMAGKINGQDITYPRDDPCVYFIFITKWVMTLIAKKKCSENYSRILNTGKLRKSFPQKLPFTVIASS